MKLFDFATVNELLPSGQEPAVPDDAPPLVRELLVEQQHGSALLERAWEYARRQYPDAQPLHWGSFAGLIQGLTTGWYGGYGTEGLELEEQVEHLILGFAGGMPPAKDGIVAVTPPLDASGDVTLPLAPAEFTQAAIRLMEIAYFGEGIDAATNEAMRLLQRLRSETAPLARNGVLEAWLRRQP